MAPDRNRTRTRTRPRSFLLGWRSKLRSAGDEALRARLRSVLSLRDALADISQKASSLLGILGYGLEFLWRFATC